MPRPRTNDPLGISDSPNYVTDPARAEAIIDKFKARLRYVQQSFRMTRDMESKFGTVAASARRLKDAVNSKRNGRTVESRLHPQVEAAISLKARKFALHRTGDATARVIQADVDKAATLIADLLDVKQGAPDDWGLRLHVEALMAMVQEASGRPVMAQRDTDGNYDPHFDDSKAQMIFDVLKAVDPAITATKVVRFMREARKKYAGKRMRFAEILPGSQITMGEAGELAMGSPDRVVKFEPNLPIYCP
jgi:hypothetical protein